MRSDFRSPQQIRQLSSTLGEIATEADGSAEFCFGGTSVVCSVYGPTAPKYTRQEEFDKATVEIETTLTGSAGGNNAFALRSESFCANYLRKSLIGAIKLSEYPRMTIFIKIAVLHDDGAMLACSLNAASLALMDAGILMTYVPAAISVVLPTTATTSSGAESSVDPSLKESFILDPTISEEATAAAVCTYTMQSSILQKTPSPQAPAVLNMHVSGCLPAEAIPLTVELAAKAIALVHDFMRKTIEHKITHKDLGEEST